MTLIGMKKPPLVHNEPVQIEDPYLVRWLTVQNHCAAVSQTVASNLAAGKVPALDALAVKVAGLVAQIIADGLKHGLEAAQLERQQSRLAMSNGNADHVAEPGAWIPVDPQPEPQAEKQPGPETPAEEFERTTAASPEPDDEAEAADEADGSD